MKLSTRSYPYPVVGNRDDVPGAAFQATLEMTSDKQNIYVEATVNCSSSTINRLVRKEDAVFVMHVECSNTLFRRAYDFTDKIHRVAISADNLNDAVEVNVFVRAKHSIAGYSVEHAHADYGAATFDIEKADILAIAEGQIFHLESNFDSLSRIGSIMQIQESLSDGDLPMSVDYNGDKIGIILSKLDFADYKLLKSTDGASGPLTTTIVLPVLVEALYLIDSESENDDRRWMNVLRRRIDALNLKNASDKLEVAQLLLELPVKRALASSRMNAEAGA